MMLSDCWYCGKEISGYVFRIAGNDCDINCANEQITRAKDLLGRLNSEIDSFVGFGLGFEKPEFFWYVFVDDPGMLQYLKDEFSAAQLGFSIYPIVIEIPNQMEPEMIPAIPDKFIMGGTSIGHLNASTTGTLGGVLRMGERKYVVSTASVLAPAGAMIGDKVVHPSRPDSPRRGVILGRLVVISRMAPNSSNDLDAAIAEIDPEILTTPRVKNIGVPSEASEPHIGMSVRKSGRTTGFTEGKILCTDVRMQRIHDGRLYYINDHFIVMGETGNFAEPGDEGSLVMDNRNAVTGMVELAIHGMAVCSRGTILLERFGFVPPECFEPFEDEM